MRTCSNSTPIIPHLKILWLPLTQALYQEHLRAQKNEIGQQANQNNAFEFFPHAELQTLQSRGPETSSLPKNNSAQRICSRQQIIFVPRAPNATLTLFPKTNFPSPVINVPLHPSAPPSPNTQQHNSEPAHPNDFSIPHPVFAPNLTAPMPHAL